MSLEEWLILLGRFLTEKENMKGGIQYEKGVCRSIHQME